MGDHARIGLDIWGDDDWLDLPPDAQHLYFVLKTLPPSFCGSGQWHPGRIAARARGWTVDAVCTSAQTLIDGLFLLIDVDTEEWLLRSWIKHDGLFKIPNMAVSMANARGALVSRVLRGVVVHEVQKLKVAHPDLGSWTRDQVAKMLTQKAVDPAVVAWPNVGLNPRLNPPPKGWVNPSSNPSPTGLPNPGANPGPTPAPSPAPSTPYSMGGSVDGVRHQRPQCTTHPYVNSKDACDDCRRRREWDIAREEALAEAKRLRHKVVVDCPECDDFGRRDDLSLCPKHPSLKDPIEHQEAM
jgi:hypothetical protein